jgi:hypothetical protein
MALDRGETRLELRFVAKQTSLKKILVKQTVLASLKCYLQLDFPTG